MSRSARSVREGILEDHQQIHVSDGRVFGPGTRYCVEAHTCVAFEEGPLSHLATKQVWFIDGEVVLNAACRLIERHPA